MRAGCDAILATATAMTVLEAAPLMPLQPDHLYIIPPNKDMEVVDGVLVLTPRKPRPHIHMPIDQFFISLAERQKTAPSGSCCQEWPMMALWASGPSRWREV
jgi:two-component system CheB/CheR fusion protein